MLKSILVGKKHPVVESHTGVLVLIQRDMSEFMGEHHGQRWFIGEHVQQATTQYDCVSYRK